MKSILVINHRNTAQLQDIENYRNTIIGVRVVETFKENKRMR